MTLEIISGSPPVHKQTALGECTTQLNILERLGRSDLGTVSAGSISAAVHLDVSWGVHRVHIWHHPQSHALKTQVHRHHVGPQSAQLASLSLPWGQANDVKLPSYFPSTVGSILTSRSKEISLWPLPQSLLL